ncbi:MAG TPA: NAD(P)-binding domain-containing protein, partial [Telluria sp.]|nr:NAD(P)-binding domain-containing protein [Telluria sp.]
IRSIGRYYNPPMSQNCNKAEIALVGAGPVGIEIAVALKRAGLDYIHLDAGQVGQTIFNFAPGTRFFSSNERIAIAGVPLQTPDQTKSTREHYLNYLRTIVQQFDLQVRTFERIMSIDRADGGFILHTEGMHGLDRYRVQKLILATGGTAGPRRLGIPGEEQANVHHRFTDPHLYFGRKLLIVGGKNSASESALRCYHVGAQVSISYRRAALDTAHIKYWLLPEINGLTHAGRITPYWSTVPVAIHGPRVILRNTQSCQEQTIETDFVLMQLGFHADMGLARMAGVELVGEREVPRFDEATMETNSPGVFVAGTAVGGTQDQYRLFIENCHVHAERIVAALTGHAAPAAKPVEYLRPES